MASDAPNSYLSTAEYLEIIDNFIGIMSQDGRMRLANNLRRYFAPSSSQKVIESRQIDKLASERKINYPCTIMFIDIRDFVKTIREMEEQPTGMQRSRDLLQRFFDVAINIVFSYEGMIGEFAGDRLMAVFGIPSEQDDHALRAVQAAVELQQGIAKRINLRGISSQAAINVGIGIHSDDELYIGDVGSSWRRELVVIGSMVNAASRVEQLTKAPEVKAVEGLNIVLTENTAKLIGDHVKLNSTGSHKLRGYHDVEMPNEDDKMEVFKVVGLNSPAPITPTPQTDELRSIIATIAEYIESYEERQNILAYRSAIESISLLWSTSNDLDQLLAEVLRIVSKLLHASNATVWMVEGDSVVPRVIVPPNTNVLPKKLGDGFVGQIAVSGHPMLVVDAQQQQEKQFHDSKDDQRARYPVRSMLGVPIVVSDDVIGVIQLIDNQPGQFNLSDEQTLTAIAAETALVLQKVGIEREKDLLEQQAKQLNIFKNLSSSMIDHIRSSLMTQTNPDDLLLEIMNGVVQTFSARYATLYWVDWTQRALEFRVVIPQDSASTLPPRHPFEKGGIAVHVAETGQPVLRSDLETPVRDVKRSEDYDAATRFSPRSMMCVPIVIQERVGAILQVMDIQPQRFNEIDLEVLQSIATTAGIALENVTEYRRRLRAEQVAAMNLMAGNMVHHFNNEVGLIPPTIEYLQDKMTEWTLEPNQEKVLNRNFGKIMTSARNALNYVKIIREPFESKPRPIDIRDAVQEGIRRARTAEDVEIILDGLQAEDLPQVLASPELGIVFRDLIKNAAEAMADSPQKKITIAPSPGVDTVKILVMDTGPGISPDKRDELFQSFGTVSTKGDESMGFGLFLANFYVEVMGGTLHVDYEYQDGACFVIELHIAKSESDDSGTDSGR